MMSPRLEQTSVLKLQLLYACDRGFIVYVLTTHFAGPLHVSAFLSLFCVYCPETKWL